MQFMGICRQHLTALPTGQYNCTDFSKTDRTSLLQLGQQCVWHVFAISYLPFAKCALELLPLLFAMQSAARYNQRMRLEIDDLPETAFWRIYCRAIENGRDVNAEIVATLSAGHSDVPADVNARVEAARRLRKQARPATQQKLL
jgi:hypothetical protein